MCVCVCVCVCACVCVNAQRRGVCVADLVSLSPPQICPFYSLFFSFLFSLSLFSLFSLLSSLSSSLSPFHSLFILSSLRSAHC